MQAIKNDKIAIHFKEAISPKIPNKKIDIVNKICVKKIQERRNSSYKGFRQHAFFS